VAGHGVDGIGMDNPHHYIPRVFEMGSQMPLEIALAQYDLPQSKTPAAYGHDPQFQDMGDVIASNAVPPGCQDCPIVPAG